MFSVLWDAMLYLTGNLNLKKKTKLKLTTTIETCFKSILSSRMDSNLINNVNWRNQKFAFRLFLCSNFALLNGNLSGLSECIWQKIPTKFYRYFIHSNSIPIWISSTSSNRLHLYIYRFWINVIISLYTYMYQKYCTDNKTFV